MVGSSGATSVRFPEVTPRAFNLPERTNTSGRRSAVEHHVHLPSRRPTWKVTCFLTPARRDQCSMRRGTHASVYRSGTQHVPLNELHPASGNRFARMLPAFLRTVLLCSRSDVVNQAYCSTTLLVSFPCLNGNFHVVPLLCSVCSETIAPEHTRSKTQQNTSKPLFKNQENFLLEQWVTLICLGLFCPVFPNHFPIQKLENISPSRSSLVNCPVMAPNSSWASRNSSAKRSST